jgi:hypothetical protein
MTTASSPDLRELEALMAGPVGLSLHRRDLRTARRVLFGAVFTPEGRAYPELTVEEAAGIDLPAAAASEWAKRRDAIARRVCNWSGLAHVFRDRALALMLCDRHFSQ